MARGVSEYARKFLIDEATARREHTSPVLIWETGAEPDERERMLLGTRTGQHTSRPRAGDPLVFEVKKGSSKLNAFATGITVGRTDNNDIPLGDESVSRFHAWLEGEGLSWRLTDAESKNGTWLGPLRLTPKKPEPVSDGQRVRFGDVELRFLLPESFFAYLKQMMVR